MPDFLRELFERPSRLLGWGLVVAVHLMMWQVLSHGLDWVKTMPVLSAVQVSLLQEEPPPDAPPPDAPPPALPRIEQAMSDALFVPTPEVKVAQESAMVVTAAIVPPSPVGAEVPVSVVSAQVPSNELPVVTESEVDYLVRPAVSYPLASKRAKERGLVLLSVVVNARGLVEYVNVYKSSGYRRLDECASRAVRHMRVKPYIRNGIAMAIEIRVPVEFS